LQTAPPVVWEEGMVSGVLFLLSSIDSTKVTSDQDKGKGTSKLSNKDEKEWTVGRRFARVLTFYFKTESTGYTLRIL
jgi:hypothetical protein